MSEAEEQLSQVIIKYHSFWEDIPDPFFYRSVNLLQQAWTWFYPC